MKLELTFNLEKETKNTYRYQEDGDKDDHAVGTLYIKKNIFEGSPDKSLSVTIEETAS
jgi:hypothetical protein